MNIFLKGLWGFSHNIFTLMNVRAEDGQRHLSSGSYTGEEPDTWLAAAEEGLLAPAIFLGCCWHTCLVDYPAFVILMASVPLSP